ncbi:MAG: 30S ribosomal protein S21 [Myxococcota bacterium]
MAQVTARDDEPVEKLLRRFKKKVESAGILKEVRRREHFLKPSIRRKQKRASAEKRRRRSVTRSRGVE